MPRAPDPRRCRLRDRPAASDPGAARVGATPIAVPSEPSPDPAADHARRLLRALGSDVAVPDRIAPAPPALAWARSGAMALCGEADGPPRFACGPLASAAEGLGRALGALCPGRGFDALDAAALLGERAALFGLGRAGAASCGGSARLLSARDGVLALNLPREDDWRMLAAWLETDLPGVAATRDWAALAPAIAPRACDALVLRGREIGLAVARAVRPPARAPAPLHWTCASRAAGATGESDRAGGDASARAGAGRSAERPPRVLDLSTLWAGPLAGALLAQAGFDVVKVEHPGRPDGARRGEPRFFDLLNADKHPCALDLATPADRALFAQLLEGADVVLESARPRALAQLGFDAETWVKARPGRLWTSITGYGRDHDWIAFGDDAAVAAGLAHDPEPDATAGAPASTPRFCADAIADPLTGLTAAVAIAALVAQGRGGLLALALADVAAHAAHATHAGNRNSAAALTLPLARRGGAWSVAEGEGWTPIAAPRARPPRGAAPALRPPDAALLARWTGPC